MGIERKNLSMSEKDRLNTAIHEAGHALIAYYNPNAMKLYKATVVSRGSSLGAVSTKKRTVDLLQARGSLQRDDRINVT